MLCRYKVLIEERTGAAKAIVLDKKKNEIYEETRIAIFLGGLPVDMSGLALRESDGANRAFYTQNRGSLQKENTTHQDAYRPSGYLAEQYRVLPSGDIDVAAPCKKKLNVTA